MKRGFSQGNAQAFQRRTSADGSGRVSKRARRSGQLKAVGSFGPKPQASPNQVKTGAYGR